MRRHRNLTALVRRSLTAVLAVAATTIAVGVVSVSPALALTGDVHMHDPSLIKVGSCTYGFSTGFEGGPGHGSVTIRKTCNTPPAGGWTYVGTVWNAVPAWITTKLGKTPPNIWAPDINYVNGQYRLYYGASIWGTSTGVMGLATAANIEGPWTDAGAVTDVNYPIDPNWAYTGNTSYVSWGSWNGIYLHVIDPATGKLSSTDNHLWKLATGIENSTLTYDAGWYYLFGSRGTCCSGVNSTYYTVVGRSTSITGPFVDRNGVTMASGGGTTILTGSWPKVAAGGGDILNDSNGLKRFAYHYYDAGANGRETLDIRNLSFANGWPVMSAPLS